MHPCSPCCHNTSVRRRLFGVSEYQTRTLKLACNAFSIMLFFITLHSDFMTSNDGIESIPLTEALCDIGSKLHTHASLAWASPRLALWIRPQHFHHETRMTGLALVVSVEFTNVIQRDFVIREKTTM